MASASSITLLLLIISGMCTFPPAASIDTTSSSDVLMSERFQQWMAQHNRSYPSVEEQQRRFDIYKSNVMYIEAANRQPELTYELGENEFTDLTNEEFMARYTGFAPELRADDEDSVITTRAGDVAEFAGHRAELASGNLSAPASIDWRRRGAVTAVKNQGNCGSCWAFTTVASIESLHKIKKGKLISLSEQELVDCDTNNNGCNGGDFTRSFQWIRSNGGITTESDYPYTGKKGACKRQKLKNHAATITGHKRVARNRESALMNAVAVQPVSVSIDANGRGFQSYKRGVYSGPCGTKLNHCVTVVGYGKEARGKKFWIVKNSWGTTWGLKGYMRMEKDIRKPQGLCGIAIEPAYPTM